MVLKFLNCVAEMGPRLPSRHPERFSNVSTKLPTFPVDHGNFLLQDSRTKTGVLAMPSKYAKVRRRSWKSGGQTRTAYLADYFDAEGKRREKGGFKTKAEAKAWLEKTIIGVRAGTHTADSQSVTVAVAAQNWLDRAKKADGEPLEKSTRVAYQNLVNNYIVERFGSTKLSQLTAPDVVKYRDGLLSAISPAMTRKVIGALSMILNHALARGDVAQNVAAAVRVAAKRRGNGKIKAGVDFPDKDEINRIIDKASGRWRSVLLTAIFTGLRSSELRGLTWDDVDLDRQVLHVRQRADAWNVIGAPKSDTSARDDPAGADRDERTKEMVARLPEGIEETGFPVRRRQCRIP
jgi:hypothetical protein